MRMKVHLFLNLFLKQQRFLFVGRTHRFNSNDLYYKILEPVYKYEPKSKKIKVEPEIKIKPEPVCKYETEVKIKQEAEQVVTHQPAISFSISFPFSFQPRRWAHI